MIFDFIKGACFVVYSVAIFFGGATWIVNYIIEEIEKDGVSKLRGKYFTFKKETGNE
jgi:hypothetical protein